MSRTHFRITAYLLAAQPRKTDETLTERMSNAAPAHGPRNLQPTPIAIVYGPELTHDSPELLTEIPPTLHDRDVYVGPLATTPQDEIVCFLEFEENGTWTCAKQLITPATPECTRCFDNGCEHCPLADVTLPSSGYPSREPDDEVVDCASAEEHLFGRNHEMYN